MIFCSDWVNIESMAAKIKKCVIFGKCAISEYSPSLLWHDIVSNPLLYPNSRPINKFGVSMTCRLSIPGNNMR